jgi:hypothetical protein
MTDMGSRWRSMPTSIRRTGRPLSQRSSSRWRGPRPRVSLGERWGTWGGELIASGSLRSLKIKQLRLAEEVSTLDAANAFLECSLPLYNRCFAVPLPRQPIGIDRGWFAGNWIASCASGRSASCGVIGPSPTTGPSLRFRPTCGRHRS